MSERKQVAEELRNVSDWFRRNGHPDTAHLVIDRAVKLLDPPARGRTVRVRIAVAVDSDGEWDAEGFHSEPPQESADAALGIMSRGGVATRLTWIECDVPLPDEATVEGEVS